MVYRSTSPWHMRWRQSGAIHLWRDEVCGVTSRCQIVQKPHNEGCINLLNDRAGPAQGGLGAGSMKSRGPTGAVAFARVFKISSLDFE